MLHDWHQDKHQLGTKVQIPTYLPNFYLLTGASLGPPQMTPLPEWIGTSHVLTLLTAISHTNKSSIFQLPRYYLPNYIFVG